MIKVEKSNNAFTPENIMLLTVNSKNLNGRADICVHASSSADLTSCPVIVLLHGVYGSAWTWLNAIGLEKRLEQLMFENPQLTKFVIAMPSDGLFAGGSGYLPLAGHGNFEKWIVEDVINALRESVDCVDEHSKVYIAGLSMGGYGALRLGCKYPQLFSGISAHSSITQLEEMTKFVEEPLSTYQKDNEKNADILFWVNMHKNDLPPIRFDCGRDDLLISGNRAFSKQLDDVGVKHQYQEFEGDHLLQYWSDNVDKTILFFDVIHKSKVK